MTNSLRNKKFRLKGRITNVDCSIDQMASRPATFTSYITSDKHSITLTLCPEFEEKCSHIAYTVNITDIVKALEGKHE